MSVFDAAISVVNSASLKKRPIAVVCDADYDLLAAHIKPSLED